MNWNRIIRRVRIVLGWLTLSAVVVYCGCQYWLVSRDGSLVKMAEVGNLPGISWRLKWGADINSLSRWGWYRKFNGETALTATVGSGNSRTIVYLLEHGADINLPNGFGSTPANYAAMRGDPQMVYLLAYHQADFTKTSRDGRTPLSIAQVGGSTEAAAAIEEVLKERAVQR